MTKHKIPTFLAGAIFCMIVVSACSRTTAGSPGADSTTGAPPASGAASSASASSIPKVPQPLDPAQYLANPCGLVPQQTMTQLGYTDPGVPNTTSRTAQTGGPSCDWLMPDSSKTAHVGIQRASSGQNNGGVAKIVSLNGSLYGFVELTSVAGYPAAYADSSDRRSRGTCYMYVGITDDLTFSVSDDRYQGQQDSCGTVQQLAAQVIGTLKGGS